MADEDKQKKHRSKRSNDPPKKHVPKSSLEKKMDGLSPELSTQPPVLPQAPPKETPPNTPIETISAPTMVEAHHHGHVHEEKKWKEYAFQFLMLFLAVFCSFLAEIQVEHSIESYREKQFMRGMLEDLASDTLDINRSLAFAEKLSLGLDTLGRQLHNGASAPEVYGLNARYSRKPAARFSDQTAIQLRNAGGMRLIRQKEVVRGISYYWDALKALEDVQTTFDARLNEDIEYGHGIFDQNYYTALGVDSVDNVSTLVAVDPAAQYMTTDRNALINYANRTVRRKHILDSFFIRNMKKQKERAINLSTLILEKYEL